MHDEVDHSRRSFVGTALLGLAAAELATISPDVDVY